jgi:hypothetical protein
MDKSITDRIASRLNLIKKDRALLNAQLKYKFGEASKQDVLKALEDYTAAYIAINPKRVEIIAEVNKQVKRSLGQ